MEKYLRHCLDSLIVPNMEKMEVLVVNDGSKDSSSSIAHEYQDKYPQTYRVIDKENGNYGSCINRGLKEATGKYVKILDADDSYDSKVLEDFIHVLENVDVDVVLNYFVVVNENDEVTEERGFPDMPKNQIFDFPSNVEKEYPKHAQMHATTYRRSIFDEFDYHQTEGVSYTDQEFVFTPFLYVQTAYVFPKYLYRYLVGRVGQTMENGLVKKVDQLMTVVYNMAVIFDQIPQTAKVYKLLQRKLKDQIDACYGGLIPQKISEVEKEHLINFDKKMVQLPHVAPLITSYGFLKGKVNGLKIWRKHNYHFPKWFKVFVYVYTRLRGWN